jgi:hypothetical protein
VVGPRLKIQVPQPHWDRVKRNPVAKGSSDSKREQTTGKLSQRFTSSKLEAVKLKVRNMTSNSLCFLGDERVSVENLFLLEKEKGHLIKKRTWRCKEFFLACREPK